VNWMCGPMHEVVKQHIPKYTGHVPGVKSENLFSKSYAKQTANAIGKHHTKGFDVPAKERFVSLNAGEFGHKNNRRIIENPQIKTK